MIKLVSWAAKNSPESCPGRPIEVLIVMMKLSGLPIKAINHTDPVALNHTPFLGCDSFNQDKNSKMILNGRKRSL
ncbi:MAG: hypothetical protein MUO72_13565 [Bacteroidales bacterium]|nr:hypothetical protein [Bacteroidales bacterium]